MKKILIVEDDPKTAFALCVRLKADGYATWIAGDAITAVQVAAQNRPDVILLDISLPAGNGLALAEQFRQLPETSATPIIFSTASADPQLDKKATELGAAGVLRKPYKGETLRQIIRQAVGGDGAADTQWTAGFEERSRKATKRLRKRILIIEDDDKVAMGLALRMKAAGFDPTVAKDALSGVTSAISIKPDLVLLDISLPAGDGFAVAERIQANVPTHTPIIFLTASKRPDFRIKAHRLGARAFFEKPYEAEALVAAVQHALA
jgi:DNA-binding response OmpR family regulator